MHGALSLHQLGFARPMSGYARHRTPIDGLYLCGAGNLTMRIIVVKLTFACVFNTLCGCFFLIYLMPMHKVILAVSLCF